MLQIIDPSVLLEWFMVVFRVMLVPASCQNYLEVAVATTYKTHKLKTTTLARQKQLECGNKRELMLDRATMFNGEKDGTVGRSRDWKRALLSESSERVTVIHGSVLLEQQHRCASLFLKKMSWLLRAGPRGQNRCMGEGERRALRLAQNENVFLFFMCLMSGASWLQDQQRKLDQLLPVLGRLRFCRRPTGPFFYENPKALFQYIQCTEIITVSILFRRLKNTSFLPFWDSQYSNSHKLEAHSQSQYTVYNRCPRGKANTQRFLYWWAKCRCIRVPSQESLLRESCPVTRSPSCERLHRQTGKPLPPPTCVVSSSTFLLG